MGEVAEQILLVIAHPGHVAVRPQQHGGDVRFLAGVDDVADPSGPSRDREWCIPES
ncbi:hypothetical protein Sme01_19950 [Sphaerisporangium melleum]|nr:hypothetical protein Sme01_19950 [Sphaerisporangium melleum]